MIEIVVRFQVEEDDDDNTPFLIGLAEAWRTHLGNPGEQYEILSTRALVSGAVVQ